PGEAAVARGLDPAEARGKQIYIRGTSPRDSELTALVGEEQVSLPASVVPCASCHGRDGRGRPEGGVIPSDIRWSIMSKSYGHVHDNGRRHPAFDATSLAVVLSTGMDPGQNRLDPSMPLYQMSAADTADLIAYLKRLESDRDPGVGERQIQIATLLPLQGPRGKLGQAMAQVLHGYFKDLNDQGGVFGRRVELLVVPTAESAEATLGNLRLALDREGVFALVGAYTVGLDEALLDLLRETAVPLIAPFTLDPGDETLNEAAFYLYAGFTDQLRVLADEAVDEAVKEGTAAEFKALLVAPGNAQADRLLAATDERLRERGAGGVVPLRYAPGAMDPRAIAGQVAEHKGDALFFFGEPAELDALLKALADREPPRVYLLSSFAPRSLLEAPPGFHYRIFVAYPTLARDLSTRGRNEYQLLAGRHGLPRDHVQAQISAFAAAKLMVEGLRQTGRDLNRDKLVDALEALYGFETGLTPPLSYGPNRRTGARGAYVMAVDLMKKSYQPVGGWHEIR
ncbi:MAG: ABC transporter substrate-binding protein, partial [Pseudomonadota bacterium]